MDSEGHTHYDAAHDRLFSSAGQAGRDYLLGRDLQADTWQRFKLGYREDASLPGTWDNNTKQYVYLPQPAIVIPWHDQAGQVTAIRYRFLQSHEYTDAKWETAPREAMCRHRQPLCRTTLRLAWIARGVRTVANSYDLRGGIERLIYLASTT